MKQLPYVVTCFWPIFGIWFAVKLFEPAGTAAVKGNGTEAGEVNRRSNFAKKMRKELRPERTKTMKNQMQLEKM